MLLDNLILKRRTEWRFRMVSHILFWTLLFLSSFVLVKTSFDPYRHTPLSYLSPLRQVLGLAAIFYPLVYVLIPKILIKKWRVVLLYTIGLLVLYIFWDAIGEKLVLYYCKSCQQEVQRIHPDYLSVIQKSVIDNMLFKSSNISFFINLFTGLLLPLTIKLSIDYYQAEREKTQLELNVLKAQVHPHFLFNTLNNLYGLILHHRTDESAETVSRLSDYMRYSLEQAPKDTLPISEEIALIKNYVALETLRLNYAEVVFTKTIDQTDTPLPPLLFLPLLENAFKYHIDQEATQITIALTLKKKQVEFVIENDFDPNRPPKHSGGLGLDNLQKRLDLYFYNRYDYHVTTTEHRYKATLKLDLK